MKPNASRRGFTLVEMLVVIAIVAVLISVIIPTATASIDKAKAAADAANLRSVLSQADILLLDNSDNEVLDQLRGNVPESKLHPDAELRVVNNFPAFVEVYYVDGESYYGLEYLSDLAANGSTTVSTAQPTGAGYEEDRWVSLSDAG